MDNKMQSRDDQGLLTMLDRGIDDMEAGHELPLDEAFDKIAELVERRKLERA